MRIVQRFLFIAALLGQWSSVGFGQFPQAGTIRIDCGNEENDTFTDEKGALWFADFGYTNGTAVKIPSQAPGLSMVARTARVFRRGDPCYSIGVPAGRYLVRTTFAYYNFDNSSGFPLIGLVINGVSVEVISVPANETFYTSFIIDASLEVVEICLRELDMPPFINAIEILPQDKRAYMLSDPSSNITLSMHLRINVGGPAVTQVEDGFRIWDSDSGIWNSSDTTVYPTDNMINIEVPWSFYHLPVQLFQTARAPASGTLRFTTGGLNIIDGRNSWLIVLYFAELEKTVAEGDRVFSITINNNVVRERFDIVKEAGGAFTATAVQFETALVDPGILDIQLQGVSKFPPLLSGIEAFEMIKDNPDPELTPTTPLRIDCGGPVSFRNDLGLFWYQDQGYSSGYVSTIPTTSFRNYMNNTMRYFPEGFKNCYTVTLPSQSRYLVRLNMLYANYDGLNTAPRFSISVQRSYITTNFTLPLETAVPRGTLDTLAFFPEGIAEVCLFVDDETNDDPFLNGLEFLPIDPNAYGQVDSNDPSIMLVNVARINCGGPMFGDGVDNVTAGEGQNGSPDTRTDKAWRTWQPETQWLQRAPYLKVHLTSGIKSNHAANPDFWPNQMYATGRSTEGFNESEPIVYRFSVPDWEPTDEYIYYLHFAEISPFVKKHQRVFNIIIDEKHIKSNFDIMQETDDQPYLAMYVQGKFTPKASVFDIVFQSSPNINGQAFGPLINGIELFRIVPVGKPTDAGDAATMRSLWEILKVPEAAGWQGDPCEPETWDGVTCTPEEDANPWKITALNLGEFGLNGTIPELLGSLTELQSLNLSGNSFSGAIPEQLGKLEKLTYLDLSGNQLSGEIPDSILRMTKGEDFKLILSGNNQLCGVTGFPACPKSSGGGIGAGAITAVVVLVVAFVAAVTAVVLVLYRRKRSYAFHRMDSSLSDADVGKGPDTIGAAVDRMYRKPRILKLPPRGPALSRSDSLSSNGSGSASANGRFGRYDHFDVEDGTGGVRQNGSQDLMPNGHFRNPSSRLRPPVDDVVNVGFEGR